MTSRQVTKGGGKRRICGCGCGKTYFRRNKEERWFFDGKRWTKSIIAINVNCSRIEGEGRIREYTPSWLNPSKTRDHATRNGVDGHRNGRLGTVTGRSPVNQQAITTS